MKQKIFLLITILLSTATLWAEGESITSQDELSNNIIKPWQTEHWAKYAGVYEALEVEGNTSAKIVITSFAGAEDAKLISACLILVPDVFAEPSYQIHGGITPNEKTGELDGYSINKWKMIRYNDPYTKKDVFGISLDGKIFVDRSKSGHTEQNETNPSAVSPEQKPEDNQKPQTKPEEHPQ